MKINQPIRRYGMPFLAGIAVLVSGCGGGGGDGSSQTPPPPPGPTITTYDVMMSAAEVPGGSTATGTASATVSHNVTDGQISIDVTLAGITADGVSLRRAFAGDNGAELAALAAGANPDAWSVNAQPFSVTDASDLQAGSLYLAVTTAAYPDGAIRGQILPGSVDVAKLELNAEQVPAYSDSTASGVAWLTFDNAAAALAVHLRANGLDDADTASINTGDAGDDGPVVFALQQDPAETGHWSLGSEALTTIVSDAIAAGELYLVMTSPGYPDGAIRGQLNQPGAELVITDLTSDAVVMSATASSRAAPAGRVVSTIGNGRLSAIANLYAINDADRVELRQAPAGQNGPVLASFMHDLNDPEQWRLPDHSIGEILAAGLANRSVYISVTTPGLPAGAARGQLETAASTVPPDVSAFVVIDVDPPNASQLEALPATVFFTLSREPLASSVTPQAVAIEASGGDGSFGDGNESTIVPASVLANGNTVEISLDAVSANDDVYRVSLTGGSSTGIVDQSGIPLDGDNDGQPGGQHEVAFEVQHPTVTATLTRIQAEIFTPTCATSGCHSGSNPPDGLLLTAGNAYANIVDVTAVQNPGLKRIEPGDPDNSYLVRKIQGTGIVANRMPLGSAPLTDAEINLVRAWVLDGAPNN